MKRLYNLIPIFILVFIFTQQIFPENLNIDKTVTFNGSNKTSLYSGYSMPSGHNIYCNAFSGENYLSVGKNLGNRLQIMEKPRLSSGQSIGCILAGVAGNIALGYAGAYLGKWAGDSIVEDGHIVGLPVGVLAGTMLGSTLAVCLVGNMGNVKGSFAKALKGSVVGLVLSAGIGITIQNYDVFFASAAILPPLCAFWLFKKSLRYKSPPVHGNALLNLREGRLRVGVPLVSVQPLLDYGKSGKKSFKVNVNVLSLNF